MNDLQTLPPATGGALIESHRAVAEAVAERQIARANPRNEQRALDLILQECSDPAFAEDATYEYPRGGEDVTGASIRLAEAMLRRWGNIEAGVAELGRGMGPDGVGYSEVRAYAIDLESGAKDSKTFTVRHWRDTKRGGYKLKDDRDIYETIANQGARRKRACILTIIPKDVETQAVRACEVTLASKVEITPELINKTVASFDKFGVTQQHIEKRIGRNIDKMTKANYLSLRRIWKSLDDGMSSVESWFEMTVQPERTEGPIKSETEKTAEDLAKRAAQSKPAVAAETGEITQDFVRKAIAAATTQDDLTRIFVGDMRKLDVNDPETRETTLQWNKKVMALKVELEPKPAAEAPKPAAQPPEPKAKKHGTAKVKATIRAAMNRAENQKDLDTAYALADDYAWDAGDKAELLDRYNQCAADLKARQ